jgi:hypothetical protein
LRAGYPGKQKNKTGFPHYRINPQFKVAALGVTLDDPWLHTLKLTVFVVT